MDKRDAQQFPANLLESIHNLARGQKPTSMVESLTRSYRDTAFKGAPSGIGFSDEASIVFSLEDTVSIGTRALNYPGGRAMERAQNVGTATAGGFLVGTEMGPVEPALANASVLGAAGATVVTGLTGDYTLPLELTRITISAASEVEDTTETDPTYAKVVMRPRRLRGATSFSFQLGAQSPPLAGEFLVNSIREAVGHAIDEAGLTGSGVGGTIKGIFNTPSVQSIVFSATPTGTGVSGFTKAIENEKGDTKAISWIASPSVKAKWQNIDRFSGGGLPLWADNDTIMGRMAQVTTSLPTTDVIAGQFNKMVIGFWGKGVPIQVLVDRISDMKSGKVRLVVNTFCDCAVTRAALFCINSGSAIQ